MSRAALIIANADIRAKARHWVDIAPPNTRIEFKAPKRTIPQNARMWAMLTDVATQLPWHGVKLTADDWKLIFLDGLKQEMRLVPNINGNGFVNLGRSSSDLSKEEMGELMTLIEAFGAQHGVTFHDQRELEDA
ncbi:MAG: NinB family protein [Rhizobiales bacterium 32-66-8]|nr:MAG: NinB family protein [Rhizobiales bacterium 32-66-8]